MAAIAASGVIGVAAASADINGTTTATNRDCKYVNKSPGSIPVSRRSGALMCAINRTLIANDDTPMKYQRNLKSAAQTHANRSVSLHWWSTTDGSISHIDPITHSKPFERDRDAGYCPDPTQWATREITYSGSGSGATPNAAVKWWLSDPPHRDALLNSSGFTDAGPGVARGSAFDPPMASPAGTYVFDFGMCQN